MEKNNEKIIKDAQFRKGLSIAFFNATNAAISLVSERHYLPEDELKEVIKIRDFFLEEHKNYYASVIANVGQNYDVKKAIEELEMTKTLDELKAVWLSFSEDERRDGEIIKVVKELKKSFTKNEKA